ncbi:zf-MYND-domain-containing protein [Basidiobolus meristosporus CBS 931.73]|uniref:Zf-MYND-domain-containing protein n=1 Tax=Basidiobolus meristosporus CBS 931.73 TaxID=1314790 RepID=A0A1Y1XTQ0_9FUNG|nr:zf-MYND-domain-containing protein [Basidiobolus meristosporus CBS 931.73]|eukprot:ORX89083.1 zf-MYND-domain-containing protein [Basidiobolus meristosporus CBS 931.73]
MRESNFSFPNQNRACVTITSALYDRRALDCTAILPLINSLSHLIYLTSTSPRIREIMTKDGGLERLIRILKTTRIDDKRLAWIWSMAFQCVVNVGVRGTETIRCRVVDAGMVEVVINILKHFLKALEQPPSPAPNYQHQEGIGNAEVGIQLERATREEAPNRPNSQSIDSPPDKIDEVLYREEDILLSLQLLAYVSKYPHLRQRLHTEFECNVFSLVEKFTSRGHTAEIQCWASIIMRNACRKDESRGGIRQCANMSCGKWERYPREFSKCRRCRKAKYCSKTCQSKAWSDGHRYWCVERHPESSLSAGATSHSQEATNSQRDTVSTTTTTTTPMMP